jgi:hypothetical protein
MARLWRLVAEYDAETATFSACAGAAQTSPYTPDFNGRLVGLRGIMNRAAATSLINHVQLRLTCTTFNPNTIHVGIQGNGIQTAPVSGPEAIDWQMDQAVQAGVPISIEARNVTADTPVGVSVLLYGLFDTGR